MTKITNLEKRFKEQRKYNPCWSDYLCFAEAIKGRRIGKTTIRRTFSKLVDKNDYEKENKKQIIKLLFSLLSKEKIKGRGDVNRFEDK